MAPKNQGKLETLLETLRHGSAPERAHAAEEIGLLDPIAKGAVPALIEALGDDDVDVRCNVAEALTLMGAAAFPAIPALIRAFTDDEDLGVRVFSVWGLDGIARDIGLGPYTAQVVPLLISALHDKSKYSKHMRGAAAGTLGDLVLQDPDEVIVALKKVAEDEDEDEEVRAAAFEAFEKLLTK